MPTSSPTNIKLPSIKFLLSSLEENEGYGVAGPSSAGTTATVTTAAVAVPSTATSPVARVPANKSDTACRCTCNCKSHSNYIPRPKNAFILYRQHLHQFLFPKDKAQLGSQDSFKTNSLVSREIGRRWRSLSPEEKKYWQDLANNEKELHKEKYPGYKYVPRKLKMGARLKSSECGGSCEFCLKKRSS